MEDLFKAGFKQDDILDALRILPFVSYYTHTVGKAQLTPSTRP
jgi:uncharacterized protein Smg (DUF494 family)